MPSGKTSGAIRILWSAEHRDPKGNLIVRQVVLEPAVIECYRFSCIAGYLIKALQYMLACYYHKCRADYAEKHRRDIIPERYRTGSDAPTTIWGAIREIIRLKLRRI